MSTEVSPRGEKETLGHSTLGHGRLKKGKWYCECDRAARCITTKKSGPNKGRKFWRCPGVDDEQCAFFLWVDNEEEAKNWLKISQPPQAPQTPTRTVLDRDGPDALPQLLETPFTKAKRKEALKDATNYDSNDGFGSRSAIANDRSLHPATAIDPSQPSELMRKAARTTTISTPGQQFIERLKRGAEPLPTPNSRDRVSSSNTIASQPRPLQQPDTSPTPGRFNHTAVLNPLAESELIMTVLELVRADHPNLKTSTELQLRHEIGLALDVGETKLRRHEATISELRNRVDELETMVLRLTE